MNKNITSKERNLIKGALRRVFSRSDLRRLVIQESIIQHSDPSRPRVKKWSVCPSCSQPTPTYLMQVDHIFPIVPTQKSLEEMTWDEVVNNIWCDKNNLQPMCKLCHNIKTKAENKLRRLRRAKK